MSRQQKSKQDRRSKKFPKWNGHYKEECDKKFRTVKHSNKKCK